MSEMKGVPTSPTSHEGSDHDRKSELRDRYRRVVAKKLDLVFSARLRHRSKLVPFDQRTITSSDLITLDAIKQDFRLTALTLHRLVTNEKLPPPSRWPDNTIFWRREDFDSALKLLNEDIGQLGRIPEELLSDISEEALQNLHPVFGRVYDFSEEDLARAPPEAWADDQDLIKEDDSHRAFIISTALDLSGEPLAALFRAAQRELDRADPSKRVSPTDPIADQIAAEVTARWTERHTLFPGEPWVKNVAQYVVHVFGKWYAAGTLRRRHLRIDPTLYDRYVGHIRAHPEDDLGLPIDDARRSQNLTDADKYQRVKEQSRKRTLRYRARQKAP